MTRIFTLCLISIFSIFLGKLRANIEFDNLRLYIDKNGAEERVMLRLQNTEDSTLVIRVNGENHTLRLSDGSTPYPSATALTPRGYLSKIQYKNKLHLVHLSKRPDGTIRAKHIPLYLSLLPPLIAIFLALIFKEVIVSLFVGIWAGAFVAGGMRIGSFKNMLLDIFDVIQKYIVHALNDSGHISVIVFSVVIGGMVAVISKNGGMEGIVRAFAKYANSSKNAQFITYWLGLSIFFDDYANTLIVGNTMRPVTDRFRVSREKLAYIVDSTAAPIAALAFITTWIGFELGQIDNGIQAIGDTYSGPQTPYAVFFESLKYAYYPILTLIFIYMLILSRKDFGPMYTIENQFRRSGSQVETAVMDNDQSVEDLNPIPGAPRDWQDAAIPIIMVILTTIFGLVYTGMEGIRQELVSIQPDISSGWSSIWDSMPLIITDGSDSFFLKMGTLLGYADSFVGLLWGSLAGAVVAIIITLSKKTMNLNTCMDTLVLGFKTMVPAVLILTFAWALALVTEELETAHFLSSAIEGKINPYVLPLIVFPLSALIAFSTGSSWSTMAILYPIAIPATWTLCQSAGIAPQEAQEILFNIVAIVIGASVLGDHCSPISDTTILSSLASQCNHINHVKTQMPYALTVGTIALVCNVISTLLGGGWIVFAILVCIAALLLFLIIKFVGKEVPDFQESA